MSADFRFDDLAQGDCAWFTRRFSRADYDAFAALSGDRNPLHADAAYAEACGYGGPVLPVHLTTMPLSAIAGMILPGRRSLYLKSQVRALAPAYFDDDLVYSARVASTSETANVLVLRTLVFRAADGAVLVDADQTVQVRDDGDDAPGDPATLPDGVTLIRADGPLRALVTGAGGAIGRATALALAARGWSLILSGRTQEALGETAAAVERESGRKPETVAADLSDAADLERVCSALSAGAGLDLVVHAAAAPIAADADQQLAVAYAALRRLCGASRPLMLRRQAGSVVFVGSSAMMRQVPGMEDYAAAKTAGAAFLSGWDQAVRGFGPRGLILAPGYVETPFSASVRPPDGAALLAEEVAEAAVDMASGFDPDCSVLWLEPGRRRTGGFGFFDTAAVAGQPAARPQVGAAGPAPARAPGPLDGSEAQVAAAFRAFFGLDAAADVSGAEIARTHGWNSLSHIELFLHLEQQFGVAFTSADIAGAETFADVAACVARARRAGAGGGGVQ